VTENLDAKVLYVGSNYHSYLERRPLSTQNVRSSRDHFPNAVTLGYRDVFWRVFSEVAQHFDQEVDIAWLGVDWTLSSIWVVESREVAFAKDGADPSDVLLVLCLRPRHGAMPNVRELAFSQGLTEQQAVAALLAACSNPSTDTFLASFRHSRQMNALFLWTSAPSRTPVATSVALFCFYSFALLMIWKVGREQAAIQLTPGSHAYRQQLTALIRLRSLIIDIERLLLTRNISNDPEVVRLAASLRDQFQLRQKLNDLLPMNEAIQRHLDSLAQLRADEKSAVLNLVAFVIAAVGLPVAVMSMLLALNEAAPVVGLGISYASRWPVFYFLTATTALTSAVLLLMAGATMVAIRILRRWSR
jgi:hypothetical protein